MAVLVLSGRRHIEMLMRPFDQQQPVCQASRSADPVCLSRRWKNVGCGPITSNGHPPAPPHFSSVNIRDL